MSFGKKKGKWANLALIISAITGTALFGASIYYSAEGTYHLCKVVIKALDNGDRIPSIIGHVGEWSAQVLLYTYIYAREMRQIKREGDYWKIKSIYQNAIQNAIENQPNFNCSKLYLHIERTLSAFGHQCFLTKNIF